MQASNQHVLLSRSWKCRAGKDSDASIATQQRYATKPLPLAETKQLCPGPTQQPSERVARLQYVAMCVPHRLHTSTHTQAPSAAWYTYGPSVSAGENPCCSLHSAC